MRVLYVRVHHGDGGIPEDQSQSYQGGTGARHFREPMPLPGLRQDPHRDDARRGESEEGEPWLNTELNTKLIGKNYTTADLYAKVTGTAKYAEDYRAEGMLFCKLLLSPLPHARVTKIDASQALAMPGVRAILTADELPAPADSLTDNGTVIKADKHSERGLTMEPVYQGEPILAVAAVDELTAAEAIERIQIDFERLPFVVDPLDIAAAGRTESQNRRQYLDGSAESATTRDRGAEMD